MFSSTINIQSNTCLTCDPPTSFDAASKPRTPQSRPASLTFQVVRVTLVDECGVMMDTCPGAESSHLLAQIIDLQAMQSGPSCLR